MRKARNILDASRSVLFVCDVQEKFRPLIHQFPIVLDKTILLSKTAQALNVPIFAAEHVKKVFGPLAAGICLDPERAPINKTSFSMYGDSLRNHELLKPKPTVILCGIEAHICLQQTALDLLCDGFDVRIVADAVSSQRKYDREVALHGIEAAGGVVTSAESAVFELLRDSSHPRFKDIAKFIQMHRMEWQC